MIIFRYLAREVLTTMLAISIILLLIILSGRFAKLLTQAASGQIDAGVLFTVIGFMSLRFLELILSLGLYIGILLSYGRLYVDSEMTVLSACGVSEKRLLFYTLLFSIPVAITVGLISNYLAPQGYKTTHKILAEQRNRTEFETLTAARFVESDGGKGISYAGAISDDRKRLKDVFVAQMDQGTEGNTQSILIANRGHTKVDEKTGRKYLVLEEGKRYTGIPGQSNYELIEFEEYHQLLPQPTYTLPKHKETEGMSLLELLNDGSKEAQAALHWRFSHMVLVLITAFLALSLSRTKPRKGRYGKILPAILAYMIYVVLLEAARRQAEKLGGDAVFLLWWVHVLFFVFALFLFNFPTIANAWRRPYKEKHSQEQLA